MDGWVDRQRGFWEHPPGEDAGARGHPNRQPPLEEDAPCRGATNSLISGSLDTDLSQSCAL